MVASQFIMQHQHLPLETIIEVLLSALGFVYGVWI